MKVIEQFKRGLVRRRNQSALKTLRKTLEKNGQDMTDMTDFDFERAVRKLNRYVALHATETHTAAQHFTKLMKVPYYGTNLDRTVGQSASRALAKLMRDLIQ